MKRERLVVLGAIATTILGAGVLPPPAEACMDCTTMKYCVEVSYSAFSGCTVTYLMGVPTACTPYGYCEYVGVSPGPKPRRPAP
jgi:hypothetical protein